MTAGYNGGDQPAAVQGAGPALADRLPLPGRDLPRPLDLDGRRRERSSCYHDRGETDDAHLGVGRRRARCCSRATCSSGRRRTAATRRRRSATRSTGRARSARWPRSNPRCCCPGHGLPIVGADRVHAGARPTAPSCSSHLHRPDARDDERGRAPRRHRPRPSRAPDRPARAAVPARRSTTSPSSSCATSGACTAAGTTAIPRTSSPRRPRALAGELADLAGGATGSRPRAVELAADGRPAPRRPPRRAAPRRPRPTTPRPRCPGRGVRAAGRGRGVDDVEGHLRLGRERVAANGRSRRATAASDLVDGRTRAGPRAPGSSIAGSFRRKEPSSHGRRRRDPAGPGPGAPGRTVAAPAPRSFLRALLAEARPKQWVKNVLVVAAPGRGRGARPARRASSTRSIAFVAFCLAASGTYFLNDALRRRGRPPPRRRSGSARSPPATSRSRTAQVVGVVCSSSAASALGFLAGWKLPVVIAHLHRLHHDLLGLAQARGRHRPRHGRGRASCSGSIAGAVGRRRPDLGLVLHRRQLRLAVHGRRQAPRRAPGARRPSAAGHRATLGEYSLEYLGYVRAVASGVAMVALLPLGVREEPRPRRRRLVRALDRAVRARVPALRAARRARRGRRAGGLVLQRPPAAGDRACSGSCSSAIGLYVA